MYPHERRDALLQLLAKHGFVSYRELAAKLHVSEITIRRDLRDLKERGLVETVQGGGQALRTATEVPFLNKRVLQQKEKRAIAKAASELVEPGMTVALSAGTTTWTMVERFTGIRDLNFVTNSTNIAIDLRAEGWSEIYLTGGHFRTPSDALVGPLAELSLRQLHTDILFLGVHGITFTSGLSTPNLHEAAVNRVLMEQTDKVVLLVDHSKWGIDALAHIADLEDVDVLVTDDRGGAAEIEKTRELGVEVIVASTES